MFQAMRILKLAPLFLIFPSVSAQEGGKLASSGFLSLFSKCSAISRNLLFTCWTYCSKALPDVVSHHLGSLTPSERPGKKPSLPLFQNVSDGNRPSCMKYLGDTAKCDEKDIVRKFLCGFHSYSDGTPEALPPSRPATCSSMRIL